MKRKCCPIIFFCVLIFVAFCASCVAQGLFSSLDGLSTLRNFRAMRASSYDTNWEHGNADCRSIAPGATLTLAELEGPGRIVHIWFTIAHDERNYGKLLVLRMYWDGEKTPSVECPINDFFCQGHGLDVTVNSLPIRVTSEGRARNCYWPMPFRKSAKITVTNEGKVPCQAFYYYIDWQKLDKLPRNTAYFHAKYRQEYPCESGKDYLILDAEGTGHYVGCKLSVRQRERGWWGEGDDRFYIDGEKVPSIQGTGSEDYFCDAWGIRKLEGLYYGFPICEGFEAFDKHTCYRFHILDPIPFKKSLKVVIEHKGSRLMPDGTWNGYVERADDFSSVAYWYQTEPHKDFAPLPPAAERIYPAIIVEGEGMVDSAHSDQVKPTKQELAGYSGGAQFFFTPHSAPASVSTKFVVEKEGKYLVEIFFTKAPDYGIYSVSLDGKSVGQPFDLYATGVQQSGGRLGVLGLTAGEHEIKFDCSSKNPLSTGYFFGFDRIELSPM